MRITFEGNTANKADRATTTYHSARTKENQKECAYKSDISGTVMDNNAYGVQGRTAEEVMQEAQRTDVAAQRNYMAVMSDSLSMEDFSEMMKEGVNPNDMSLEEVVTFVDRMKAELIKSGVHVEGYTDTLDKQTLTAIVGSEAMANRITEAFRQNDVPLTKENAKATVDALNKALELESLNEGELKYAVSNHLEPTIENLYTAQNSGAKDADRQSSGYYEETYGYLAKKAEMSNLDSLVPQMEKIITEAGLHISEETINQAKWIVEKGLPLTKENLLYMRKNLETSLPTTQEEAISAIAGALAEGKKAVAANLYDGRSKYQKAWDLNEEIKKMIQDPDFSITERRKLEEIRLKMTAEVNVRLIESGFSLDTSGMEGLIEALKEAEKSQAQMLFPEDTVEDAIEKHDCYQETKRIYQQLPSMPVAVLGRLLFESEQELTAENFYKEGNELKTNYEKANQSYETLMTAPRRDLGDHIKKAFANIDDILKDLEIEITGETQKAVRVLSYNQIPITPENIESVLKADRTVQRVIEHMTPAATLKMIRDGVNPLTTNMEQLEEYFKGQNLEPAKEMENYSKFLYQMEQNKEITEQERDAYIGVYRLLRQIEKSDGAVVGSIIKQGTDLNFRQLLSAVRTAKKTGMNIAIRDDFGGITAKAENAPIDEQINQIDDNDNWEDPSEINNIRKLKNAENEVIQSLIDNRIPLTVSNIIAATGLNRDGGVFFNYLRNASKKINSKEGAAKGEQKIAEIEETSLEEESVFASLTETMLDNFTDKESAASAYETFTKTMSDMLQMDLYQPGQSSVDIKAMKNACVQLSLANSMAKQETYELPVMLNGELTSMKLTIIHKSEMQSQATISVDTSEYGKVSAALRVNKDSVSGYIAVSKEGHEAINRTKDVFQEELAKANIELSNFTVVEGQEKEIPVNRSKDAATKVSTKTIYDTAKLFLRALQATI